MQLRQISPAFQLAGIALAVIAGIVGFLIFTALATVGGLIGVPIFEKRKGDGLAPPPPTAY
jgi:hypothetical protein